MHSPSSREEAAPNPFFHRGPVHDPAYFFGRSADAGFLASMLRQGQCVAVSGPRRIGKTSLLFHLAHPHVAAAHGLSPDTTTWAYLDGGALEGLDETWLYGAADRALGGADDAIPYARFVERLRELAAAGRRLVLALDEFELFAANRRLGPAPFNRLRALSAQLPLQFVTASKDPLVALTFAHPDTLASPFFNIFAPLSLGLLSDAEADGMLAMLSARGGRGFGPATRAFLLGLAGPHPLFAQVAGYRAFAALRETQDGELAAAGRELVRAQTQSDLDSHLRYYWGGLDAEARYTLAALPLLAQGARTPAAERLAAEGLLRGVAYLGDALETFVRRQEVAGLLQGGPFIIDLRRGQVATRQGPVHLTPTERAALTLLLQHRGQVLAPEAIEAALWPGEASPDPERARGVMKKLRAALGPAGAAIVNRRGQGYMLQV
jgi:hypothetical protein